MAGAFIHRSYLLPLAGLIVALCALAGCRGSGLGIVEGKVTVDGQPVNSGRVIFRGADGKNTAIARIAADGTYRLLDVPCDTMKVTVNPLDKLERIRVQRGANGPKAKAAKAKESNTGEAPATSGGAEPIEPTVKIPEKYQDPDASGLTLTVKGGTNTFNIEISSK